MPVPEIERFRQKYPQYNDLDDETLAEKLATKYPAYADLPGKVQADLAIVTESKPSVGFAGRIPLSAYQRGERNILGNIFERPAPPTRRFI